MNLALLTGREALERITTAEFQSKWTALHAACPWATMCQHPDFVLTWYACYQSGRVPVIVSGTSDTGSLIGLLTLSLGADGKTLVGAGEQQAEYQGWMHLPGVGDDFIMEAIPLLREAFPSADLCLKYLPPAIPLPAIALPAALPTSAAHERWDGLVSLRRHRRPLMKIEAAAMARQRNKKNHRQNYNRLSRIGEVGIERIVGHARFIDAFDEIRAQYDFRQAALYRSMPFSTDPAKKLFYLQLHDKGCLHATILKVGDTIAATHIGLLSPRRAVHLGITTHAPTLAAHSPGQLLLAMLGVQLASEQIPWLDLTPGGDQYKESFATTHDVVFELTVYSNKRRRWQREAILQGSSVLKSGLHRTGIRPADVLAVVRKLNSPLDDRLPEVYAGFKRRFGPGPGQFEYRGTHGATPGSALPISKNNVHDVLKFDAPGSSAKYQDFLHAAMRRMERSHILYSLVQDGVLRLCCWAHACLDDGVLGKPISPSSTAATVVLSDLYVHRDVTEEGLVKDFLAQVLGELHESQSAARICYRGVVNKELKALIYSCGFGAQVEQERDGFAI